MKKENKSVTQALILAAGNGLRLCPPQPKPLFNLLGRPLLERTLLSLQASQITEAYIVLGYKANEVRAEIEKNEDLKIRLHWLINNNWDKPNGISLIVAEKKLKGPFILTMCDHIFDPAIIHKLTADKRNGKGIKLGTDYNLNGIFDLDDATKVMVENHYVRKINKSLSEYNAVDTGFFLATPIIFDAMKEAYDEGNYSLSDGVQKLAERGLVYAVDIEGIMWEDIDNLKDAREGERKLLSFP